MYMILVISNVYDIPGLFNNDNIERVHYVCQSMYIHTVYVLCFTRSQDIVQEFQINLKNV